jgi:chitobiase/beta-hexosaminidase-like protein
MTAMGWCVGTVLFAIAAGAAAEADFFVAPSGKDTGSGRRAEPFATLGKARDAVRALLATDRERDVTVLVRGGVYRLDRTVVFSLADSAAPGQRIHYTLDSTDPTPESPRYTKPFGLDRPATVRAKAFAPGCTDLVGATAHFASPPEPIADGFETTPLGSHPLDAQVHEENADMTIRISDAHAAAGTRSVRFIDGPGQRYPFNPHMYCKTTFTTGRMVGRFALRVDAATHFYYQWRDYTRGYQRGPTVTIRPGGKLVHNDRELATIPIGQWVRFEVTCTLGDTAPTFDMKMHLPGKPQPLAFTALACEAGFRKLDWIGFVAVGQKRTVFYVDDIEVRRGD